MQAAARPFGRRLAAIVLLGLALRAIYAYVIVGDDPLLGDALEFHLQANYLADGHGYIQPFLFQSTGRALPSADKPPLFVLLEAAISLLGGRSWQAHHLVGILAGGGTVAVCGLVARRLGGATLGLVAAAIAAVYPLLVAIDGSLRSESVYVLSIALVLLASVRLRERPSTGRAAVLGVAIAAAALTRSEALVLLVLLVPWLAGWRRAGVAALTCVLVLTPWLVRCWIVFDQPVLVSTNVGGLLAGANCASTYDSGNALFANWDLHCLPPPKYENEAKEANHLRRLGLDYARDHAGRVPVVIAARLGRSFELYRPRLQASQEAFFEGRSLFLERAGVAMYYVLVALAVVGAVALRRARQPWQILLAPVALVVLSTIISYGFTRFRAAAEPSLVILAAAGLVDLAARLRSLRRPRETAARTG
jgi:4-amino-4-deoxy-L-arabinose transferase-like glycosyltransferase